MATSVPAPRAQPGRATPAPAQPRPGQPPAPTRIPVPTPAVPAVRRVPGTPAPASPAAPARTPAQRQGPTDAQLASFVDQALLGGQEPQTVADGLAGRGVPRERSEAAVVAGVRRVLAGKVRKRGLVEVGIGAGLFAVGAAITGYTFLRADVGETFVVTTGLFLAGLLTAARGGWKATVTARKVRTG